MTRGLGPGWFVAVVGPSGAGKDTLIRGAAGTLRGDRRFVFARRVVTRPADSAFEDHDTLSPEAFRSRRAARGFALTWQAHGLCYGLPANVDDAVAAGAVVVANLSRTVLSVTRARYARTSVVLVTAPPALLKVRLATRGREGAGAAADRLARMAAVDGDDVVTIVNDRAPAPAIDALVGHLRALAA